MGLERSACAAIDSEAAAALPARRFCVARDAAARPAATRCLVGIAAGAAGVGETGETTDGVMRDLICRIDDGAMRLAGGTVPRGP